jgi:hypothetical protein
MCIEDRMRDADPSVARAAYKELIDSVTFTWETTGGGERRKVYTLKKGVIKFNGNAEPLILLSTSC